MRKSTFFGAAAVGIAGTFLTATAANAGVPQSLVFDHETVAPGQTVGVSGVCYEDSLKEVRIQSPVLEPVTMPRNPSNAPVDPDVFSGKTTVKKDAKPATYTISYKCGAKVISAKLTVVAKDGKPAPKPTNPDKPKPTTGQVVVKPKGAAETGDGEVVEAAPQSSGPGAGVFVVGGAAVLAVGAGGAFALRRVRKEN